ncbi:MAG: hypothetical protein P4L67_03150 [Candidatus Pacebacteria bacterium]|nr:hypothetical protein [Candidatus Paceibacterota bacterium]
MNKKITTIEDLAVVLEGEFRGIEKRFDGLEACVHKLELPMDRLELRMDKLEVHMNKVEDDLKTGMVQLRKDIKEADTRSAVIALEIRVNKLEGSV